MVPGDSGNGRLAQTGQCLRKRGGTLGADARHHVCRGRGDGIVMEFQFGTNWAVYSTLSAFWILVANSWQQTPAGFSLRNGRAELDSFFDAVFNPSTLPRFFHTMDACLIVGAFLVAGTAA